MPKHSEDLNNFKQAFDAFGVSIDEYLFLINTKEDDKDTFLKILEAEVSGCYNKMSPWKQMIRKDKYNLLLNYIKNLKL